MQVPVINFLLAGVLLFFSTTATAGEQAGRQPDEKPAKLSAWGEIRFRSEAQDNFNLKSYGVPAKAGDTNDTFLLGRFRLGIKGNPLKNLFFSAGFQHAEAWGLALDETRFFKDVFDRQHNPYEDDMEPYNTYLLIKNLFTSPVELKAGRQLISYGDKRIFGPGQWGNAGRWGWDAVKLHCPLGKNFVDAYYGKTMIHDPNHLSLTHNHGFESMGIYSRFHLPSPVNSIVVEPFTMTKHSDGNLFRGEDGRTGEMDAYYTGVRIAEQDRRGFDWDATWVMQKGDYATDTLDAFGYHIQMAYNFNGVFLKPRIAIDYSYASGDEDPSDGEKGTFDGAFGARAKLYGRMNLFHWKNIKDAAAILTLCPAKTWRITAEAHVVALAETRDAWYLNPKAYRDPSGNSGDGLGRELDLVGTWNIGHGHQLQAGGGYFRPDEFAKKQASDTDAAWAFVQWNWRFDQKLTKT
ncbi:MAG: alginate export family protein [Thermodesulfobacteriota bacterium]|nr:alginate export family protein [Thermodesulfobacteriota bacterium]